MAADLHKIKRRIGSIRSTRKITNAMQLVASVKLRRFKDACFNLSKKEAEMKEIMRLLLAHLPTKTVLPYVFLDNKEGQDLYIVINSDLGLCGNYNNEIYKLLDETVKDQKDVLIIPIGSKGARHLIRSDLPHDDAYVTLGAHCSNKDIRRFTAYLLKGYEEKKFRSVSIIATAYINPIRFKARLTKILPLSKAELCIVREKYPPLYDTAPEELLSKVIPACLMTYLQKTLFEAELAEFASRRNAMETATDNADDLIESLTLAYNKARQAAITREIADMTGALVREVQ